MGKEICDVVLGFDFGTSCSKVVVRTPYHNNGRAFATPFGNAGHKSCPYLLPSTVWVGDDGRVSLAPITGGYLLRDIKYHLMRNEPVPAVNGPRSGVKHDGRAVAAGYLALALREVRGWFLMEQKTLYGDLDLRWALNIGLPSADFADEALVHAYEQVTKTAWLLSVKPGAIRLEDAIDLLRSPEEFDNLDDHLAAEIRPIPEVAAEVAGYAKSTRREEGLHILVDIGATTLDVCSFILFETLGDDCYALLTADVQVLGASILYQERVSAVRHAVDRHVRALWDEYDPVSAMADDVEAYSPSPRSVAEAIRQHDSAYSLHCRRVLEKTIVDLKTKRDPRSPRWKSAIPLFLSGGGSVMPFYRAFFEEVSTDIKRLYNPCQGIRLLSLMKPDNFDANVDEQTHHRLAVAWGLSYPETDIGKVSRPSETDDVPPRERYDWGGREYISKDMV
jgi:hypothetical protein